MESKFLKLLSLMALFLQMPRFGFRNLMMRALSMNI
nr:MAG TPA: hypothetical protein [Caudoviricetes sp.]